MTYGVNQPRGFQVARSSISAPWNGQTTEYPITATDANTIFTGDPVTFSTLGTVTRATASSAWLGVFMGTKYQIANNISQISFPFWPGNPGVIAGTTPVAMVIDDPWQTYTIQETSNTGASGTPLTQGAVGLNANFLFTAGSTVTGLSGTSLDNTTTATTLVGSVKILAVDPTIELGVPAVTPTLNGGQGTVGAFANWLVQMDNGVMRAGSIRAV
jgi:hypothetical protein